MYLLYISVKFPIVGE